MDALFPIKVHIPDEQNFYTNLFQRTGIICFLFSSGVKIEEKNIKTINKIYPLGEIVKNEKALYIYYIEALCCSNIIINTTEYNSFLMKINNKDINFQKNFFFNKSLFDKEDKIINKLNCFDIYEEFEIYYRIHYDNKNKKSLNLLIISTMNIIKDDDKEISNFSFFLTILKKDTLNLIKTEDLDKILKNIKNIGDLTKISKDELYNIFDARKKEKILNIIILIYMLLSEQNFEEIKIKEFCEVNDLKEEELINYLEKYKNLFLYSLQLFPKYNFLFKISHSLYQIKTILKCSNSLSDFIYSINETKEDIIKILSNVKKYKKKEDDKAYKTKKKDKKTEKTPKEKNEKMDDKKIAEEKKEEEMKDERKEYKIANPKLILNDFFDLEIAFNQEFDENFYLALNSIINFEAKINTKIFYSLHPKDKQLNPNKLLKKGLEKAYINLLIFSNMRNETIFSKGFLYELSNILIGITKMKEIVDSFNYFEIIEIIDILLHDYNKQKDDEFIKTILFLIERIKFEKINKELKPYFSQIKWENIFGTNNFKFVVAQIISSFINIENFEFIFTIINKLIEEEENLIKEEKEKKCKNNISIDIYKENIIFTLENLLNKYLSLLNGAHNINNDNKDEFIHITSKLIYLKFKYGIKTGFFASITEKIGNVLLNDIIISTLNNYEISELDFNDIISLLVKKGIFGNIYNDLMNNKEYLSKFEKLINKCIINDDIEQFLEKFNFNNLLFDILYKKNFFKLYKESYYVRKTIPNLENIGNNIIGMNNLSLKQMESLLNNKERLAFFSLIGKKKLIIERLNKNIYRIRDIIKIRNCDEFLILNNFHKFKFPEQNKLIDSLKKFFDALENKKIHFIKELEELEKKAEKIKYIIKLITNIEKLITSNYFFGIIKEKNWDCALFQQIFFLLNDENLEKINTDVIPLFNSFLLLDKEKKEEIIMKLDFCNYLLKTISLNTDFEKALEMKKEINNDSLQIYYRILILVMKDKIKEEFNNYLLFKEKLKYDKNNKKENNKINNNNIKQFIIFIKSLRIKKDNLYNRELNDLIEELKNNTFIKIINNLFKNKEALDFLFSITSQDCRNIQELAGEVHGGNNQNFLSIEELLLIEKIVESFEYIKNKIKITKIKMRKK